jgi:hypothetical protein
MFKEFLDIFSDEFFRYLSCGTTDFRVTAFEPKDT